MSKSKGVIYILTNPSFPDYVKIGYADDIETRLAQLNRTTCTPYAFRIYATYEVDSRLSDKRIHSIIDKLNPDLRSVEEYEGKSRVREFYAMSPEDAYSIFEAIAEINDRMKKLHRYEMTISQKREEKIANEIEKARKLSHFSFADCGIPAGSIIHYVKDENITCEVIDDRRVKYKGEVMYLSGLARLLLGGRSYHVCGPMYFTYEGEILSDLRHRLNV